MKTMTVTAAKPILGDLVDRALNSELVYIRRGQQLVRLVPAVLTEALTVWPEGAFDRSPSEIAFLTQTTHADESAPFTP